MRRMRGAKNGARSGGGEAVESDIEAELQGLALKRVGMRLKASSPEKAGGGGKHRARHMERRHLSMSPPPG